MNNQSRDREGAVSPADSTDRFLTGAARKGLLKHFLSGSPEHPDPPAPSTGTDGPLFEVHVHGVEEMAGWSVAGPADHTQTATRKAVARCDPLPPDEPMARDDPQVEDVLRRVDFVYPHLASASVRATMAASEFKGAYDFTRDGDEAQDRAISSLAARPFEIPPSKYTATPVDQAAHRGIITHRVLQHLDFAVAVDARGVASELQRMIERGLLAVGDRPAVLDDAVAWFVSTPLADTIRGAGAGYRREFRYVTTERLTYFDRSVDAPPDDRVLVRGMVDGVLTGGDDLQIVDFKTDAVQLGEVPERCERYRPQMTLYSRAMSRAFRKHVGTCWLVFLTPRQLVPFPDPAGDESV